MVGQTPVLRILENVSAHFQLGAPQVRSPPSTISFSGREYPVDSSRLQRWGLLSLVSGGQLWRGGERPLWPLLQSVPASDCRGSPSNTVDVPRGRRGRQGSG